MYVRYIYKRYIYIYADWSALLFNKRTCRREGIFSSLFCNTIYRQILHILMKNSEYRIWVMYNIKVHYVQVSEPCSVYLPRKIEICRSYMRSNRLYGDLVYKLRRAKDTPNFISSGSKIVKRLRRRQYDPLIIERTIGLVLGPSTALYGPFRKHCTLTNKAMGTIWWALSKPPQRRQGPDLRPLWLLVGTPSAIRPELAFSRAEHSQPYLDVTIYIFAILYLSSMLYVYRFLWPIRFGWPLVCCLYKEVYLQIFKRVSCW